LQWLRRAGFAGGNTPQSLAMKSVLRNALTALGKVS